MSQNYESKVAEAIELLKNEVGAKALRVTLAFSHQSEDAITIDLAKKAGLDVTVFTLETHKLFDESQRYQEKIEAFYGIDIASFSAHQEEIIALEEKLGEYGIFDDVNLRKECCRVRKLVL